MRRGPPATKKRGGGAELRRRAVAIDQLQKSRVRELRQLQRLLREPCSCRWIDDAAPFGIGCRAGDTAVARAVRLARHLYPEIGVDESIPGISSRRDAGATPWRVAPVLSDSRG